MSVTLPRHDVAPAVSILTPAYNSGHFIAHTIESALRQTFDDFEMLVDDDGSVDDTAAVVTAYAARDPRVRLLSQPNGGIAAARNAAMAQARGRLYALLDSDDLWLPSYLEEQVAILSRRPDVAIVSANAINFGGASDGDLLLPAGVRSRLRPISLLTLVQIENSVCILSIFRREVAEVVGGFDCALRRSEDYDFWLRAAASGFRIVVNPKPLGLYRRRPDSISADEVLMLKAMQRPLLKLRDACADRPEVQTAVDIQLARFARRMLVARARNALVEGDMHALATEFAALADETGAVRYRFASWLSGTAPATLRWAYSCKRTMRRLSRLRLRARLDRVPLTSLPSETLASLQDHAAR
jgi:GT2 family glycosyltransferase